MSSVGTAVLPHMDVGLFSLSLARWRGTHYRDICVTLLTLSPSFYDYLRHFLFRLL